VVDPLEGHWRGGDFNAGDVLLFHGMTVHRGTPNLSNSIRLSMDARYQRARDPIVEEALMPVGDIWTWDQIYGDWKSDELKYYWRALNPRIIEYNSSFYEWRDNLAFEAAEKGDETARAVLWRIAQRAKDPAKRDRALAGIGKLDAVGQGSAERGAGYG
jgi:hypothetical protein